MRGFLARAGHLLGRLITSMGYGPGPGPQDSVRDRYAPFLCTKTNDGLTSVRISPSATFAVYATKTTTATVSDRHKTCVVHSDKTTKVNIVPSHTSVRVLNG